MALSQRTKSLLLSMLGSPEARNEFIANIEAIRAEEDADIAILINDISSNIVPALNLLDSRSEASATGLADLVSNIIPAVNSLDNRSAASAAGLADLVSNIIPAVNTLDSRSAVSAAGLADLVSNIIPAVSLLDTRSAVKAAIVETANATDLATAIVLLNEIKTKLNLMNINN